MSDTEPTRETERVAEDVAGETSDDTVDAVAPERSELPPLAALNAFATYDDPQRARDAVLSLERAGIDGANISALALDTTGGAEAGDESTMGATVERDRDVLGKVGSDVGHGAAIGAVAGALGGAAIAVAVPGVGTVLGAGMLAIAAGGAAAGTSVGGFAGAVAGTPSSPGWEQALIDLDDGRVVVGAHHDDRESHDAAVAALEGTGALSLRCVDPDGQPC